MSYHVPSRLRGCVIAAASTFTVLCAGGTVASAATSPSTSSVGKTAVTQGITPTAIPGTRQTGATATNTKLTVSFILKAQNLSALESKVSSGWSGPYLTTAQFAKQYGQSPAVVKGLESYLAGYGITSTADGNDLDVTAKGTAAEFNQALTIGLNDYTVPAHGKIRAQSIYASAANPQIPSNLASHILSILGLSNYSPFASEAQPAKTTAPRPASSHGIPFGERTPADFESEYGLDSLESGGHAGNGTTIGIVTLASLNPNVPEKFWDLLGLTTKANRITLDNVDGGAGPVSLDAGSDETTLDVEQSGALAPRANIDVYQAPNTDYGFVDAFFAAASDNVADAVSASWGESETAVLTSVASGTESPTYAQTFDEAFLEMAAQGQSSFVSSADFGAYTAVEDVGTTNLDVDSPGDSPYTTSAGGTTNPGTQTYAVDNAKGKQTAVDEVNIPSQMTWNWGYLWPLYAAFGAPSEKAAATDPDFDGGGGGGYSAFEPRPSYQHGVSGVGTYDDYQYLTPTDPQEIAPGVTEPTAFQFTPVPSLGSAKAPTGRVQPDLSFDADPQTGYAVYDPQFQAVYGSGIVQYGGTSFVAPQLNGVSVVYDSAIGHRVGFWNPVIYSVAQTTGSPFDPIDSNQLYQGKQYLATTDAKTGATTALPGSFASDNLFYTGTPGTVYNPGSGLGYANLGQLEAVFASH